MDCRQISNSFFKLNDLIISKPEISDDLTNEPLGHDKFRTCN